MAKSCKSRNLIILILFIIFTIVIIGYGNDDDDDDNIGDIGDIRIGMTAKKVIEILGIPNSITPFGIDLGTLYLYDNIDVWIDPDTQKVISINFP